MKLVCSKCGVEVDADRHDGIYCPRSDCNGEMRSKQECKKWSATELSLDDASYLGQ